MLNNIIQHTNPHFHLLRSQRHPHNSHDPQNYQYRDRKEYQSAEKEKYNDRGDEDGREEYLCNAPGGTEAQCEKFEGYPYQSYEE